MEVTKPSEPSRQRVAWRLGEQAGRNASERRAGLEKANVGADPPLITGKAAVAGELGVTPREATRTQRSHRGSGDGMSAQEIQTQHGKPQAVGARDPQPDAREGQAGPPGVAERPVVPRKPGNAGGGKGPQFKANVRRGTRAGRLAMSLPPPPKVQKLQAALHAKAKGSPGYRFYALYDKVYRRDVLECAYVRCRANGGAPGVDGQTFEDIEAYGRDRWLDELAEELRSERIDRSPVRRVYIPKAGWQATAAGDPLRSGIAWCRWRRCWSWSRSSRPTWSRSNTPTGRTAVPWTPSGRSTGWSSAGHTEVVDADLVRLLRQHPARRTHEVGVPAHQRSAPPGADQDVAGGAGGRDRRAGANAHRTTRNKDEGRGSPQGSPISPLLSISTCVGSCWAGRRGGTSSGSNAHIVNYADDFVICCRGTADEAMAAMRAMMSKLKLTVNETKTRLCRLPEETFDFLGYTIGRCYSPRTGQMHGALQFG